MAMKVLRKAPSARSADRQSPPWSPSWRRETRVTGMVLAIILGLVACTLVPPPVAEPSIVAFGADAVLVAAGAEVVLSWVVVGAASLRLVPGDVDVSGRVDFTVRPTVTTTYTLFAVNEVGEDAASVEVEVVVDPPPPPVVRPLLVAGQSNAQGRNVSAAVAGSYVSADEGVFMLGNDDVWKVAYEPLDDCTDQVDVVSMDPGGGAEPCVAMGNSGVSMGVAFGNALTGAVGGEVVLVPAARGGSDLDSNSSNDWEPRADRDDPLTLFGSAVRRWRLAGVMGASVEDGALFWFQGESEATAQRYPLFVGRTDVVFDAFEQEIGAPVIFAQLSRVVPAGDADPEVRNLLYQQVRERQRVMEVGARLPGGSVAGVAESDRFMVVTHDLPMDSDGVHLSVVAQLELGRRVALAFREHVLGEEVDGSGPRLVRVDRAAGDRDVYVRFDGPVTVPVVSTAAAYAGYFRVFDGGSEVVVESIVRDPSDPATVLIRLAAAPSSVVAVRYMPPPTDTSSVVGIELDVVRAAACAEPIPGTTACLPAPAFGDSVGSVSFSGFALPALFEE